MKFPQIVLTEDPQPVLTPAVSKDEAIKQMKAIIRKHNERVANSLDAMWGHRECDDYLRRLVFDRADPADLIRVGFKPEVIQALLVLSELHTVEAH